MITRALWILPERQFLPHPTSYTDPGVLNIGDRFYYVVVAVNS